VVKNSRLIVGDGAMALQKIARFLAHLRALGGLRVKLKKFKKILYKSIKCSILNLNKPKYGSFSPPQRPESKT
jgi:hypothetical protein